MLWQSLEHLNLRKTYDKYSKLMLLSPKVWPQKITRAYGNGKISIAWYYTVASRLHNGWPRIGKILNRPSTLTCKHWKLYNYMHPPHFKRFLYLLIASNSTFINRYASNMQHILCLQFFILFFIYQKRIQHLHKPLHCC